MSLLPSGYSTRLLIVLQRDDLCLHFKGSTYPQIAGIYETLKNGLLTFLAFCPLFNGIISEYDAKLLSCFLRYGLPRVSMIKHVLLWDFQVLILILVLILAVASMSFDICNSVKLSDKVSKNLFFKSYCLYMNTRLCTDCRQGFV